VRSLLAIKSLSPGRVYKVEEKKGRTGKKGGRKGQVSESGRSIMLAFRSTLHLAVFSLALEVRMWSGGIAHLPALAGA